MMKTKESGSNQGDSFFAPLADAMTIVASIFFIIFLSLLFTYKQQIVVKQKKNQEVMQNLEKIKQYKMDKALDYMSMAIDNKVARIDTFNKSLILDTEFLFDTGSDRLKEQGQRFIAEKLTKIIESILTDTEIGEDITIAIEGHSDCQLFERDIYENWILSSKRAISVLRNLEKNSEIIKKSNRIKAIGYGDRRPFKRERDDEEKRVKCCKIVNSPYEDYTTKKECVQKWLAKDRRAEIRLDFSPSYIEDLSSRYKELLSKYVDDGE